MIDEVAGFYYDFNSNITNPNLQMKTFLESISSKLEALKAGKLSQTEIEELVDEQLILLRILFIESSDGMMVVDGEAKCFAVNQAQLDMLGYSREEILNMHAWDWDAKLDKETIRGIADDSDNSAVPRFETFHKRKDGIVFPVEVTTNGLIHDGQMYRFCIARDMTEIKQREAKIRKLSCTDELTGLTNRREFSKLLGLEIERARRYGQQLSLLMFDLDFFKRINDSYGHDVGDKILVRLTLLLQGAIRKTDTQARWGGEEFMILMPDTCQQEAVQAAHKLRILVEQHDFEIGHDVTISIGAVEYQKGDTDDSLLKRVDDALYHAKGAGRNQVKSL